jgi:hypothetical protein
MINKRDELIKLLKEGLKLVSEFKGGYSNNFISAEDFYEKLNKSIQKLEQGENEEILKQYYWFAPTCDWDDIVGKDGTNIGNQIFEFLSHLKKDLNLFTLIEVIIDYQSKVQKAVEVFNQKLNRQDLLTAWRHDKVLPQIGNFKKDGIVRYAFHGTGLEVIFDDKTKVDFDFYGQNQNSDGFDLWRIKTFIEDQPKKYEKYLDSSILKKDFNQLIIDKKIVKPIEDKQTELYIFAKNGETENKVKTTNTKWWQIWK